MNKECGFDDDYGWLIPHDDEEKPPEDTDPETPTG